MALQEAYRENSQLQRANGELRKQLGSIATKLGAGMIPDESDLQLSSAQENGASGTSSSCLTEPVLAVTGIRNTKYRHTTLLVVDALLRSNMIRISIPAIKQ